MALIAATTNVLAAALALAGGLVYVFVYTVWLKRSTTQNIVIGGAAGAFPPLVGWAAATGSLTPLAWVMFAIIFFWTPPHFWALALLLSKQYSAAKVPMLPVVAGEDRTQPFYCLKELRQLVENLLPFEPREALELHVENGLRLNRRQAELRHQAVARLGHRLRSADQRDDGVEPIERAHLRLIHHLGVGPDPSQIIKDVPTTTELVKLA